MKSKSLFFLPATILLILVYGFGGNAKYPGGSPGGYTGSPGDGKDCTQCHGGTASPELNWITSDIPDAGYIPGETYTITATVSGSGDKGFEISPQDESGSLIGTLIAGSGNHLVAGNKAVTQNNASSSNPKIWQFEWIAPEAGTGNVTFYGAFTVNKPVTKLSTYIAHENTGVSINEATSLEAGVYPNPARDKICISYIATDPGHFSVNLICIDGSSYNLIEKKEMPKGLHDIECPLPSGLAAGVYILTLQDNTGFSSIKLFIQ